MLGRKTLLINPPLINGIAFTRQGRCQEREDVLGTTKPPFTLAVLASLLRVAGMDVRLIDATASRLSVYQAPMFCFGPHASTAPAESMARASAADVDGMFVGEPEDGVLQLASLPSVD